MSEPDGPVGDDGLHSLDDHTIERIAAGEVIERPASAVKELLENSLDAGASRVAVTVEAAGTERVRVTDDGVGMTEAAVRRAIHRHTTSKLSDAADLDAGLETFGFRGEALYTIAAVSKLTIRTRPHGARTGTELRVAGGELEHVGPTGCPPGTTVDVSDLFYNTPARRSFLSAPATEFDHVNRIVGNYALANPDVAVELRHDGRETFSAAGTGDLRETVMAVYGRDVAESLIDVDHRPDGPFDRIHGAVSDPEITRSRPRYLSTFVNGRYVRSDRLRDAVLEAYGRQLAPNRYPFAVVFVELDPATVDVNVHPRKLEVRFDDPGAAVAAVESAVRDALLDAGLIRRAAARGRSTPVETIVRPTSTDDATAGDASDGEVAVGTDCGVESIGGADRHLPRDDGTSTTFSRSPAPSGPRTTSGPGSIRPSTDQRTIDGGFPEADLATLPPMRILGQLHETFILGESTEGLLIVDQHAADERVQYEGLRERFANETTTQALVEPITIQLTADEAAAFPGVRAVLESMGFTAEPSGSRTVRVTGVPAVLDEVIDPAILRDAIGAALETVAGDDGEDRDRTDAVDDVADALLADLACHPAITGNESLTEGSVIELLEALDACADPYACPHGRPTVIRIDRDELADRFERDYPGHASRRPEAPE